ncbi:hypothetical protein BDR06DRAFT_972728 [Suillus hirtellus]|nr:hypothetical protein BDR06DRAFT_972728 [Suillus hirtellus]
MDNLRMHRKKRHERTIDSSRSTPQNPSSLRSGQALDQHSTRLALQSCLKHLDRLEYRVHEEIQGVRSLFRELLDNCQSDATTENSGGCNSTVDSKAGFDGLNTIHCLVQQPAPHGTSFRVTGSLSEGTGSPRDLSLCGTPDYGYEPTVQPFQGIYFGEHVLSSSSAGLGPNVQLFVPVVQASQAKDKVKCTWDGCSALVNKDNLTRHVGEVHEGKIKAVCADCGKEFKRPYQMNEHILSTRCGKS